MRLRWLFGHGGAARGPMIVAFVVLLGALLLRALDPAPLSRIRDFAFDTYQRLKPRVPDPDLPVRVVDIDEKSLAALGQWPWPRTVVAQLVGKLAEKGAAAIAFDVVFAEPDRLSMAPVTARSNDDLLAEAIKAAPVVTAFGFDAKGVGQPPRRIAGLVHNSGERDPTMAAQMVGHFIPRRAGAVKTIDVLEGAAKGNGSVITDVQGGIVRRVPMLFRLAGQRNEDLYPAVSLEALRVAQGASTYVVRWSGAQGLEAFGERTGVVGIRVGSITIDTDFRGRVTLYDSGHLPARFVSAIDVLKDAVPTDRIDGHIVFVGTSALGLKDQRSTALEDSVPGVEIHAQIVEQVLSQTFLERPDYANGSELLFLAAAGLVLVLLLPRLSAASMGLVAALFVAAGLALPWLAFDRFHLLFDPIYPPATFAAIYVSGSALAFMRAERERREIRGAFSLYLSPDQVEAVVRNPERLKLGGQQREITVMFSDIRGFTRVSEQFDPQGLTRFMNELLTPMTDVIHAHKGTIDKYMGDAIMAFWNAPLDVEQHAARGCEAALAMQAGLRTLNAAWQREAEAGGRRHMPVAMGIGLNTGQATVGNFGSEQRLTYSCLGDEVNLAARLEGLCKIYDTDIVIGEKTQRQVPGFATLELDLAIVKGKTRPERIHALMGGPDMAARPHYGMLVEKQASFLRLYRAGRFAQALERLEECAVAAQALGWQQGYFRMMQRRIDSLMEEALPDWDGVYVAAEK